jgi:hypothetical protein
MNLPAEAVTAMIPFFSIVNAVIKALSPGFNSQLGLASLTACISASI